MNKGLIHIYTGDGKGKTTAAMGLAFRAAGQDKKVYILQFLKARKTGEKFSAEKVENITFARANKSPKFIFQMNEEEKAELKKETKKACENLMRILQDSEYEIIIVDEIFGALANGMIDKKDLIKLMKEKSGDKELILTGRGAPEDVYDYADYVSNMTMIKHPFEKDIKARKGIEF